jgi:hypothetical protein
MKISKVTIAFLLPLCLFLGGCESIKNITDPLGDDKKKNKDAKTETKDTNSVKADEINLYFVRPADVLTIGQDVELYVDDDEVGELSYSTKIQTTVKPGTYELATKVGWSLSYQSQDWVVRVSLKVITSLLKKIIILRLFLIPDCFVGSMKLSEF